MLGILKFFRGRKPSKDEAEKKKEQLQREKELEKTSKDVIEKQTDSSIGEQSEKKVAKKPSKPAVKKPAKKIDPELFSDAAIKLAEHEAILSSGRKAYVGEYLDVKEIDNASVVHSFKSNLKAYPDWQWEVVLCKYDDDEEINVLQSYLAPSQNAHTAPKWVEFRDRLKPSDIGDLDEMTYEKDDLRLEQNQAMLKILQEEKPEIIDNLALEKNRVLNSYGKEDLAQRWYDGSHGPFTASTRISSLKCNSCAFYLPLANEMGQLFGVCANAWSRDDGKVVSTDHGCGMHSETDVTKRETRWKQGELVVDDKDKYDLTDDIPDVSDEDEPDNAHDEAQ